LSALAKKTAHGRRLPLTLDKKGEKGAQMIDLERRHRQPRQPKISCASARGEKKANFTATGGKTINTLSIRGKIAISLTTKGNRCARRRKWKEGGIALVVV